MLQLRALLLFMACLLIGACDGERVDYGGEQYDISWLWVAGERTPNAAGTYGVQGEAANTNRPGARTGAVSWTDAAGDFWLFGGFGRGEGDVSGYLNDLWQFDGTGWVWVAGSKTIDGFAVYGSEGVPAPENVPGARRQAAGWVDAAGNLYLFGGRGLDAVGAEGKLNDVWKYDVVAGNWAWLGGSSALDAAGSYGEKGVSASTNIPGSRYAASTWVQAPVAPSTTTSFWLFGGEGVDGVSAAGSLSDVWKLDVDTGEWTWVSGANTAAAAAVYGSTGVYAAANTPSGRSGAVSWFDQNGQAWLFGGEGVNAAGGRTVFNELWKFKALADLNGNGVDTDPDDGPGWAWAGGSQGVYTAGEYGGRGIPSFLSFPPSRAGATAWLDANGTTLWMSGGAVESVEGTISHPNDLWRYDAVAWTWAGGSRAVDGDAAGDYLGLLLGGQPAGRRDGAGWSNVDGLWLLGGGTANDVVRNDFWFFKR